jgi:ATP-dependent Lon protease
MTDKFLFSNADTEDALDFMPMIPMVEEDDKALDDFAELLPILPLRNTVLYPGVVIPITVGRDKSIAALNEANKTNKLLGVFAQQKDVEEATGNELFARGTVAKILKLLKMPDGSTTVILQGRNRIELEQIIHEDPFIKAKVKQVEEQAENRTEEEFAATVANLKDQAVKFAQLSQNIPNEAALIIRNIENPAFLCHFIASNMNLGTQEKQNILETTTLKARMNLVLEGLSKEIQLLELKNQINSKTHKDIDQQQREYFLHQQLKAIQEELGDDSKKELANMKERGAKKNFSEAARKMFDKEVEKLNRMHSASAEYSVVYNYVETLLELPWGEFTTDNYDMHHAEEVLHDDHYG